MAFGSDKKDGSRDFSGYGYSVPDSGSGSFFGKTMKIEGEINSDEDLTIEGKVIGELEVSKTLIIGNDGYVNGKISANVVHISGEAEGRVTASEKLEISARGKFSGDLQSDKIVVAEGAIVKGTINLIEGEPKPGEMPGPTLTTDTGPQDRKEQQDQPEQKEEKEQEEKERPQEEKEKAGGEEKEK
jgi:cytoskeletal protein CcmA (bactofilin family)